MDRSVCFAHALPLRCAARACCRRDAALEPALLKTPSVLRTNHCFRNEVLARAGFAVGRPSGVATGCCSCSAH